MDVGVYGGKDFWKRYVFRQPRLLPPLLSVLCSSDVFNQQESCPVFTSSDTVFSCLLIPVTRYVNCLPYVIKYFDFRFRMSDRMYVQLYLAFLEETAWLEW